MEKKYSIQEGLESLDRIHLMMGYDMSKSFSENKSLIEQDEKFETQYNKDLLNAGEKEQEEERNKKENEKNEFLKKNKQYQTPYQELSKSNNIIIPAESKVSLWKSEDDRQKSIFGSWVGTGWQEYIPNEDFLKKILPDNTLRSFTTPDNVQFFTHLERTSENPPYVYKFYGYMDKNGNSYNQEKYVGKLPELLQKNWFEENFLTISQIAISLAVGFLTGGETLLIQALAQLGVDVAFTIVYIQKGDYPGAALALIMGLIPVGGRLFNYGTTNCVKFLKTYGEELSKIKDSKTFSLFYNSLSKDEQILMTRIFKQTPGELKKMTEKTLVDSFKKSVADKTIQLSKIPKSQLLWWKQLFVEGGISLSIGVGLELVNAIKKQEKEIDVLTKTLNKDKESRKKEYLQRPIESQKMAQDSMISVMNKTDDY